MALRKKIKRKNGIELDYHRIAMIKVDLNQQITVLVQSYLNEEGRNYEKAYAAGSIKGEPTFPYVESEYLNLEYSEDLDILKGNLNENAYKWLKKQSKFEDAEDI